MKYTIGEVANFLHLSRDMIRYYEKKRRDCLGADEQQLSHPTIYGFFELLDTIQHKNLKSEH